MCWRDCTACITVCIVRNTAQETDISVDKSATLFTACKEYESANAAASEVRHFLAPAQSFVDFLQSCERIVSFHIADCISLCNLRKHLLL